MIGLVGRKLRMEHIFLTGGKMVAVTVVEAGPCAVTQIKTKENDGYNAVQLGFGQRKRINKPMGGKLKRVKIKPVARLCEFRVDDPAPYKVGTSVDVSIFKEGDKVKVIGWTKGRGFAGGVKRWGWGGGPAAHGSCFHRRPGSIGQHTFPGRVWKNKKMPGRYGNERVSIRNLQIVKIEKEKNVILVKGAIPGPRNGLVIIEKSNGS